MVPESPAEKAAEADKAAAAAKVDVARKEVLGDVLTRRGGAFHLQIPGRFQGVTLNLL